VDDSLAVWATETQHVVRRCYLSLMNETPECPVCSMTDLLEADHHHECATCGHEWSKPFADEELVVHDANGAPLADGDSVVLVKDLKVKGTSSSLKVGTKISGIRLVAGDHEIDCKVAGTPMMLKAEFLRKA
jgi:protein PhnA